MRHVKDDDDTINYNWLLLSVMNVWHLEDEVEIGPDKSHGEKLKKCFIFKRDCGKKSRKVEKMK